MFLFSRFDFVHFRKLIKRYYFVFILPAFILLGKPCHDIGTFRNHITQFGRILPKVVQLPLASLRIAVEKQFPISLANGLVTIMLPTQHFVHRLGLTLQHSGNRDSIHRIQCNPVVLRRTIAAA